MEFAVGDNVVHPRHGPGRIIGLEHKELLDDAKRYFIIETLAQELTVYVPALQMGELGIRRAMSQAKLPLVMDTLRGQPRLLPDDYKERQEEVWEKLKTGYAIQIAEVVRDLVWHKDREHLTKKDADYLRQGQELLAAEVALASGVTFAEAEERIDATLETALIERKEQQEPSAEAA